MAYNEQYNTNPAPAFVGMIADSSLATIVSRTAEADVAFGVPVARGAAGHGVRPVAAGDTSVFGISVRSQATNAETPNVFPTGDTVSVMRKGPIWVTASVTVVEGDPVQVNVTTGAFIKTGGVAIEGATYESSAAAGSLARVHVI